MVFMVAQLKCVLTVMTPQYVTLLWLRLRLRLHQVIYEVLLIDLELFAQTNVSYTSHYRVPNTSLVWARSAYEYTRYRV